MITPAIHTLEPATLQRTLQALRRGTMLVDTHPLMRLQVVNAELMLPAYIGIRDARRRALGRVLVDQITAGLTAQRRVFELDPPDEYTTLTAIRQAISMDGQQQNPELTGWSWLYYGYVRVDLNLNPGLFAEWAMTHPRTLRRYRQRALDRLVDRLQQAEQAAMGDLRTT